MTRKENQKSGKTKQIVTSAEVKKELLTRYPYLPYLIIVIVIFALYFQTIFFGFTFFDDDFLILKNFEKLTNTANINDIFLNNSFLCDYNLGFYRPLQTLSFMFDSIVGNQSPSMFHFSNLLLHFLTCCLVFNLFRLLHFKPTLALTVALFYAVHPLFVHAVVWLPSRGDLMVALFCLLSFIFLIKYSEQQKSHLLIFHILSFYLATISKEPALLFPVIMAFWYYKINKNKLLSKDSFTFISIWVIIDVIWLLMWIYTVEGNINSQDFGIIPLVKNISTIPEVIGKFFIPIKIQVMPIINFVNILTGIIVIVLVSILAFLSKTTNRFFSLFGLVWFFVLIIPGMLYSRNYADTEHIYDYLDHRNYLPMIGFSIFFLEIISNFLNKFHRKNKYYFVFTLLIIFFSISFTNSKKYESPEYYFNTAINDNPDVSGLYFLRANILKDNGNIQAALKDYNTVIKMNPKKVDAFNNRGSIFGLQGKFQSALNDYNKALNLNPELIDALYNRALVKSILKNQIGAIHDLNRILKLNSKDYSIYGKRAELKITLKDYTGAIKDYSSAIELKNNNSQDYYNRANLFLDLKKYNEAIKDYDEAIKRRSNFSEAFHNRGIAKYQIQLHDEACNDWHKSADFGNENASQMLIKFCK